VDENLALFKSEDLPAITESPGFRAVRHLTDRTIGRGLTAIIVSDEDGLRAAEAGFETRRERDKAHGMRFGEITHREVVLVDKLWQRRSGRLRVATREPASCSSTIRGNTEEHHREHGRPPAFTALRVPPAVSEAFVVALTRACPRFPSRCSMVRRGSTVRVRRRALIDPLFTFM
jgi:hypothetical protein